MANSSIITEIKNKFIKEVINDKNIVDAIDSALEDPESLINNHIFRYNKNTNTIQKDIAFITVQVHIPDLNTISKTWVRPILEVWVICHTNNMVIKNIPKVTASRTDYLSQLIDERFNGRSDYGYGRMFLTSNIEGVHPNNPNFLYRRMIFETKDLNDSLCG